MVEWGYHKIQELQDSMNSRMLVILLRRIISVQFSENNGIIINIINKQEILEAL